jgi:hypothetical protein
VGALAAAEGTGTAWLVAGVLLGVVGILVAGPLRRAADQAMPRRPPATRTAAERAEN